MNVKRQNHYAHCSRGENWIEVGGVGGRGQGESVCVCVCVCGEGGGGDGGKGEWGMEEGRKWRDGKVYPMQATGLKGH